jgi:uncharacterized protein DUF4406
MRKAVYVSGPLTTGLCYTNTRNAVLMGEQLWQLGLLPLVPHAISMAEFICPKEYEVAMEYDFELIRRMDAIYRLPGKSPGGDREVEFAKTLGIPVFFDLPSIAAWAAQ